MRLNILSKKNSASPASPAGTRPIPKGSLPHRLSSDPFLDWVLILAASLIISLSLVCVGVSVYLGTEKTLSGASSVVSKKDLALPLDEGDLAKVLNEYDKRSRERDALTRGYSAPRDPSLP